MQISSALSRRTPSTPKSLQTRSKEETVLHQVNVAAIPARASTKRKKLVISEKALENKRAYEREKKRRYRAKMSNEALEKKREYSKRYIQTRKENGTWKCVATMTEREKRRQRKQGRERARKYRQKKALVAATSQFMSNNSSPDSDGENLRVQATDSSKKNKRKKLIEAKYFVN